MNIINVIDTNCGTFEIPASKKLTPKGAAQKIAEAQNSRPEVANGHYPASKASDYVINRIEVIRR